MRDLANETRTARKKTATARKAHVGTVDQTSKCVRVHYMQTEESEHGGGREGRRGDYGDEREAGARTCGDPIEWEVHKNVCMRRGPTTFWKPAKVCGGTP